MNVNGKSPTGIRKLNFRNSRYTLRCTIVEFQVCLMIELSSTKRQMSFYYIEISYHFVIKIFMHCGKKLILLYNIISIFHRNITFILFYARKKIRCTFAFSQKLKEVFIKVLIHHISLIFFLKRCFLWKIPHTIYLDDNKDTFISRRNGCDCDLWKIISLLDIQTFRFLKYPSFTVSRIFNLVHDTGVQTMNLKKKKYELHQKDKYL